MNPLWLVKIFGMVSGINIKKVLGIVVQYWREILIALLITVVSYQNMSGVRFVFGAQTIPALEAELAESQKNFEICADGNEKLSMAIDENNARIAAYENLTEKLKKDIKNLNTILIAERVKTNKEVDVILKEPTPDSCKKSIEYLRKAGEELTW